MSIDRRIGELETRVRRELNRPPARPDANPGHVAAVYESVGWQGEPLRIEVVYIDKTLRNDE